MKIRVALLLAAATAASWGAACGSGSPEFVAAPPDASAGGIGGGSRPPSSCSSCVELHAECGTVPDGCGSTLQCGGCPVGQICRLGQCSPQRYCGNHLCDSDENCESCPSDCGCATACIGGSCCVPNCSGKACGEDGCGGQCGPDCGPGFLCDTGKCVVSTTCGNGAREPGQRENCDSCKSDCTCQKGHCFNSTCCDPVAACAGKECGDDGCGGSCGTCTVTGESCHAGRCTPDIYCGNMKCDADETCSTCSSDCGCAAGSRCGTDFQCHPADAGSSGILLRGGLGPLGPAPAPSGTIRLVRQSLGIASGTICNATTCLLRGGISP